jgi:PAS domain S-box-containing protein
LQGITEQRSVASSTRARLILLCAAILVPVAIFAAILLWRFSITEKERYRAEALGLAQQVSTDIDRELVGMIAALEAIATSPSLQPGGDLAGFDAQAHALLRSHGDFVAMRDRAGQLMINTRAPYGTPLPHSADPELLALDKQVFETGKPAVSDLFRGTTTGRPLVGVEAPVFQGGKVAYVLSMALDPGRLAEILAKAGPSDWTIALLDRNRRIIARSRQQDTSVGRSATADLIRETVGDRGTWAGTTLEGTAVLGAYERSSISGWRVAIGVPEQTIEAPLHKLRQLIVGSTLVVFLLSAGLAARVARTITDPLHQLTSAAVRLGRGETVPALDTRLREADAVGRALVGAEAAIRDRETALQVSEERFRAAVRAVDGVVWTTDPTGRMTRDQPGWAALTGQSPDEYEGYGWSKAVHPDDAQPTIDAWEAAVRAGSTFIFEHRVRRSDGAYRRFAIRGVPVVDGRGVVREWVGVHTDITEEHDAKASLAESQALLRAVFEAVPVGVVIGDAPDGRIVEGNAQTERIFRHPVLRSTGIPDYQSWISFHPDGRSVESTEYPLARVIRDGEERPELEVLYQRGDGTRAWVRLIGAPIRRADGSLRGGVVAILDIDRQRRAEDELRLLNATLARRVEEVAAERDRIWRFSAVLMVVMRFDVEIVAVNPAWMATLGWREDELVGIRIDRLLHSDDYDATMNDVAQLAEGRITLRFENRLLHKDGSYRWVSWTSVPEGGLIHAIGRDITAEKAAAEALARTEEQLRQSQKMEVVGQLTGGVAHDFNNLLTVITGNLDMAQRRLESGDRRVLHNIENAMEGAQRAATLTHRLLAFARQSPLRPQVIDLNKIVAGMSELIRRTLGENIAVETVLAGGLWQADADPNQLENAILNLAVNARDAMPEGGKLTIETGNTYLDAAYPSVRSGEVRAGQYVMVAVCDTGTGISPEVKERVFEPFFTTKPVGKGTGLGLSQVFGFLRQSGGHAALYSEIGHGTTVKLYFPRMRRVGTRTASASVAEAQEPALGSGETILVIEDEKIVYDFTVAALQDAGYRVFGANDGPAGLALLDAHPEVVLLLTDVVLAGPMNGRKVAEEALRMRPDLRVMFTTGYTRNAIVHHGRLDDDIDLITKPFTATGLAERIREMLA